MSATGRRTRITVPAIRARKGSGEAVVCLTAYTTPMARAMDGQVDLLLVGDSLGMVLYGLDTTLGVTLDMMVNHGAAVVRGADHACVIVDMPFGTYEEGPEQAFRNAARIMAETGADGVKLEGGRTMAPTIRFLTDRGIPVFAHVGLLPQSVQADGGFRVRGRTAEEAEAVLADARATEEAGAFAMVIEGVVEPVAADVTRAVSVPTIGIGASPRCDGQILVAEDMLGLFSDFQPRHVRRYADLAATVSEAAGAYAEDVRAGRFPGPDNCFGAAREPDA